MFPRVVSQIRRMDPPLVAEFAAHDIDGTGNPVPHDEVGVVSLNICLLRPHQGLRDPIDLASLIRQLSQVTHDFR